MLTIKMQSAGSIYLFGLITESKQNLLMQLQQNLAANVDSLGGISFNTFRAYSGEARAAQEPLRFVDGELIEAFLDCSPEIQEECVKGLGAGVEEVKETVEALRRLH